VRAGSASYNASGGGRISSLLLAAARGCGPVRLRQRRACRLVDALHERAAAFYESFGFLPLPESLRLGLPMRSIEALLAR